MVVVSSVYDAIHHPMRELPWRHAIWYVVELLKSKKGKSYFKISTGILKNNEQKYNNIGSGERANHRESITVPKNTSSQKFWGQTVILHVFGKINDQFITDRDDRDVQFPLALMEAI